MKRTSISGHVVDVIVECDRWLLAHRSAPSWQYQAVTEEANRLSAHSRSLLRDAHDRFVQLASVNEEE